MSVSSHLPPLNNLNESRTPPYSLQRHCPRILSFRGLYLKSTIKPHVLQENKRRNVFKIVKCSAINREVMENETESSELNKTPKAVVVGGGPAGLLCALVLANRGFRVDVVERYSDVLAVNSPAFSITYSLTKRSIRALAFAGVELPNNSFTLAEGAVAHLGNGPPIFNPFPSGIKIAFISRKSIVALLMERAKSFSDKIKFLPGWTFDSFEKDGDIARFVKSNLKNDEVVNDSELEYMRLEGYSLLIGGDGVNSKVRSGIAALESKNDLSNSSRFTFSQNILRSNFKVLPAIPSSALIESFQLEKSATVQAFIGKVSKTTILCAPYPAEQFSVALISKKKENFDLSSLKSSEDVENFLKKDYLELYKIYSSMGPDTFETIAKARIGNEGASTFCSQLNYGKILLIGDAAHSMSPSLGQGCNSALEDSFVLGQILSKFDSVHDIDIKSTLQEFNDLRLDEVRTIVKLSADPPSIVSAVNRITFVRAFLTLFTLKFAKRFLPFIKGPRPLAAFDDIPYSEMIKRVEEDEQEAFLVLSVALLLISLQFYLVLA